VGEKEMNERVILFLKVAFSVIYSIGIICVVVFSGMYLQHSTIVPYPDTMIPMMKYEIAAWKLIAGLPFMVASCISVILVYKLMKITKIILVSLPAVVCLMMCISYFLI
jgi:hypothetical protein